MKAIGIYKIENNVNHKVYVGQSIDIAFRWRWHKCKLNGNKHTNSRLQNAWNKYGANNFSFSILELCERNKLDERETYWKSYYDTLGETYNLGATGMSHTMSAEARTKISKSLKGKYVGDKGSMFGKKHTQEWRDEMSKRRKGENCYWYGKQRSEETKNKIAQRLTGRKANVETIIKKSKTIIQYDLNGNYIKEWVSNREASRQLGFSSGNISRSCNNGIAVGNYMFRFKGAN